MLKYVFSFLFLLSSLHAVPNTPEEVELFKEEALTSVDQAVSTFNEEPCCVRAWEEVINPFIWKQTALVFLPMVSEDKDVAMAAESEVESLFEKLHDLTQDEKIIHKILSYATKENHSPTETYKLKLLIKSIAEGLPDGRVEKGVAKALLEKFSSRETAMFEIVKGNAPEKEPSDTVTVLNWNVCCFDEGLSMLFGGVRPWEERIDDIAETIQKQNADIICLQELFSTKAADELVARLKNEYAFFYVHIGPKVNGFDLSALGISSGLFVASKYPLTNPVFHAYTPEQTPPNRAYGFFTADIGDKMHIITTHLQPGSTPEDKKFRKAQIKAIVKSIPGELPTYLVGDLNIERDGEEYKSVIAPHFQNHYKGAPWTCCELSPFWFKAGENVELFQTMLAPEWIDYFLSVKNQAQARSIKTKLVTVNDTMHPREALSDHQAMITIIE